jgi:hypothetical protein
MSARRALDIGTIDEREARGETIPPEERLAHRMSEWSEECYCAGWLSLCEYEIWDAIGRGVDWDWGQSTVPAAALAEMKALSDACGGWVIWDDANHGETFVPLSEWLPMAAGATRGEG